MNSKLSKQDIIWDILMHLFNFQVGLKKNLSFCKGTGFSIMDSFKSTGWNLKYCFYILGNVFNPYETKFTQLQLFNHLYDIHNIKNDNNKLKLFDKIKEKFNNLTYFCYRKNIKFFGTSLRSDTGWGCMIRCYQMLLSRAFYKVLRKDQYNKEDSAFISLAFFQENQFSVNDYPSEFLPYINYFLRIVVEKDSKGLDKITINSFIPPFAIQNVCYFGQYFYHVNPGEWHGDYALAQIYSNICDEFNLNNFCHIISFQTNIILKDIINKCFTNVKDYKGTNLELQTKVNVPDTEEQYLFKRPGVIFVSVRLGIRSMVKEYLPSIKNLFSFKGCLGILGGKVNSAFYFIGYYDEDNFLYMDPHITKNAVMNLKNPNEKQTYFSKDILSLKFKNMQPSFTIGFIFRNPKEFDDLLKFFEEHSKREYPCFGYMKERPDENVDMAKLEKEILGGDDDF